MEQTKNFKKNFIWNVLGTGLNAFNSLFFLIIVTRINGTDNAGIFTIAFSTACVIYIIGTYAGRVYQVTENDKSITDKDYIVNRVISFGLMILATISFVLVRKYNLYKSTIFLLLSIYKGLEAFSDVLYGIMQKNDLLYRVGQSYFLKSILSVIIFFIVDFTTKNLIYACVAIILIWIFLIIIMDLPITKKLINEDEKFSWDGIQKIFKNGFFVFAITFLGLYVLNATKYSIDTYLSEETQAIFGYIVMPATAIGLAAQLLIHPFLNQVADLCEKKDFKELRKLCYKLAIIIFLFGIICAILAYFIGTQILGFIYGVDLNLYKLDLAVIIIASTLYTIGVIYSSILTSTRKTFSQFVIYIVVAVFAYISANLLTKYLSAIYCMAEYSIEWIRSFWNSISEDYLSRDRKRGHIADTIIKYTMKNTTPTRSLPQR